MTAKDEKMASERELWKNECTIEWGEKQLAWKNIN